MPNRISLRRRQLGLSQMRLAELMGVEQPTVARWERERRGVKIDTLIRLARVLDCDPRDLMPDDSPPPPSTMGPPGALAEAAALGAPTVAGSRPACMSLWTMKERNGARPVPGPTMMRGVAGSGGRRKSGFFATNTGTRSPTCRG